MSKTQKQKINTLATLFYKMGDHESPVGYDFSTPKDQQEKLCWNQSVVAYAMLRDNDLLKYQVMDTTKSNMAPGDTVLVNMFDSDIDVSGIKTEFVGMAEDGTYLCRNLSGKIISWKYCKAWLKFKGETK